MRKLSKIIIISGCVAIILVGISILALNWFMEPMRKDTIEIKSENISDQEEIQDKSDISMETNSETPENAENIAIYEKEQREDEIINILISGVDARKYDTKSRSDTIILASYNKTQHKVKLISFMRDSYVLIPDHGWNRINAATVYGGTGMLINTLNENFDLDIQNYVQVKFDDFKTIIDLLGGIDVELSKAEINYINNKLHTEDKDWNNDIKSSPGVINLNGAQALWHCRNRTIGNSDFERTERQREVLGILVDKATSMKLGEASSLVFEIRKYINTNLDMTDILSIGSDVLMAGNIEVESARIPFDGEFAYSNKNGASVLELDIEDNKELLHEFIGYNSVEESTEINTD